MKILHITDSHGTAKSPEKRLDLYYYTFLKKLAELSYIVKLQKIDIILHTGDLFHTSIVSMKFMGQVAEIIKAIGVPFYVVPGNHDINGYTIDTIDQTSLGVLIKTGVVRVLDREHPIIAKGIGSHGDPFEVAISGQEYYADIDTGKVEDFEMQQPAKDLNLLCIHGYITNKPQHPNIRHTLTKDVITDADIVLSGHWHQSFSDVQGDTEFYNPGSMLRVEATPYNKTFMPQYGILSVDIDEHNFVVTDYQFHKFRSAKPGSDIFDFNAISNVKQSSITLTNFKTSLANTMASSGVFSKFNQNGVVQKIIKETYADMTANNTVPAGLSEAITDKKIKDCLNNANVSVQSNDNLLAKGYIESTTRKTISKVTIHNFLSHKDTTIDFAQGVTVIVGESNKGKSSIFRAIRWVTNNEPNGSTFIMTGETECYVLIEYSDGSFIKRSRTIKDSGSYEIGFFDENKTFQTMTLKGFGSDVPVEVLNIHQMPKVSITNDIEVNLNIMSQLDPPFLLTSSQAQKAEAIGKIANTDIIDEAIKLTSSSIAARKKVVKLIKSNLKTLEAEKDLYKNVTVVQKLFDVLPKVQAAKVEKETKLLKANRIIKTYNDTAVFIDNTIKNIDIKTKVLDNKQTLLEAEKIFTDLKAQTKLVNSNIILSNQIETAKKNCDIHEAILKQKDIVLELETKSKEVQKMVQLLNKFNLCNESYKVSSSKIVNLETTLSSKKENITKIQKTYDDLVKLNNLFDKYEKASDMQKDSMQKVDSLLKTKNKAEKEYDKIKKEMKEFVLSSKVCPYCGQEVTEKCVEEIIKQREES